MKMKLIASGLFAALAIGAGIYSDADLSTKPRQFAAVLSISSALAFLSLLARGSSAWKAAGIWVGAVLLGGYMAAQPPRELPPERDTVVIPARRDSPAGQINIGTPLHQASGELVGTVAAVSDRDPTTGAATKMVLIRTPGGSSEWKTRETVIQYYKVKP